MDILIVDNEVDCLSSLKDVLEMEKFTVRTARSAAEAVNIVRNGHKEIGLILMDLSMPGMTGWDAAMFLKNVPVPIVVVSAIHIELHRFPRNVVGSLVKPYDAAAAVSVINKYWGG